EVRADVASEGFRWVTVGAPGQDVDIVLSQPHGGRSPADGDALQALVSKGALQAAIFRADDLAATFERLSAAGVEVLQEPTDQPWGVRDCAVRDPSGNMVRIQQAR
ncbi:MAG: VOC family protein, partial [Acidobacteriota bacterium]|nr:VOC family protein [Acidobacteriota bacterium]